MTKKKKDADDQNSFLFIFKKTNEKVNKEWSDWKKKITPIETTATTIIYRTNKGKK